MFCIVTNMKRQDAFCAKKKSTARGLNHIVSNFKNCMFITRIKPFLGILSGVKTKSSNATGFQNVLMV